MSSLIKKLIRSHLEIIVATGLDNLGSMELIVICILLKFIKFKCPKFEGYEKLIETLTTQPDVTEFQNILVSTLKEYHYIDSDLPKEVLDIKNEDLGNVTPLQFVWMLKEWDYAFEGDKSQWCRDDVAVIFELLESTYESNTYNGNLYYTPSEIVTLLNGALPSQNACAIFDPFARAGDFVADLIIKNDKRTEIKIAIFERSLLKISKIKMFMLGVHNIDWFLSSTIIPQIDTKFDCIVCNPPFGVSTISQNLRFSGEWSRVFSFNRSELDFICYIIDHLNENGCAGVVVPAGMLSSGNKVEHLRKKMIDENILDVVIKLPSGLFHNTGVSTAILIFNKNRKTDSNVLLIDTVEAGYKEKKKHHFSHDELDSILNLVSDFRGQTKLTSSVEGLSFVSVTKGQMSEENYDLECNRYFTDNIIPPKNELTVISILESCQTLEDEILLVQKRINNFFLINKII